MIFIGKAPYRISLLGGGSDLDWFLEREEYGLSIGYSLNQFSYTVVNKLSNHSKKGIIKYSSIEKYLDVEDITHPLIREALKILNINEPLEISTLDLLQEVQVLEVLPHSYYHTKCLSHPWISLFKL